MNQFIFQFGCGRLSGIAHCQSFAKTVPALPLNL